MEGGRDYEVTVEFDKVGVKKMFAKLCQAEENIIVRPAISAML